MSSLLQNSDALVTAIVAVGMGAAAVIDLRTRRIPNLLTASLAAVVSALPRPASGAWASALRCSAAARLAFMMPGHLFGATGGRDREAARRGGRAARPTDTIYAFLYTAIRRPGSGAARRRRRRRLTQTRRRDRRLLAGDSRSRAGIESTASDNRFRLRTAIGHRRRAGRAQLVTE
jgi:hypothetical protein